MHEIRLANISRHRNLRCIFLHSMLYCGSKACSGSDSNWVTSKRLTETAVWTSALHQNSTIIDQLEMGAGRGRVRGWRKLPGHGRGRITDSVATAQSIAN